MYAVFTNLLKIDPYYRRCNRPSHYLNFDYSVLLITFEA